MLNVHCVVPSFYTYQTIIQKPVGMHPITVPFSYTYMPYIHEYIMYGHGFCTLLTMLQQVWNTHWERVGTSIH